jgi:phage-related tail protein
MNVSFKAFGGKEWSIHEDIIVIDKKDIQIKEIDSISLYSRAKGMTNGVLEIQVGGKTKLLTFGSKQEEDGMGAYDYIQRNCKKGLAGTSRTFKEIEEEISHLPNFLSGFTQKEINELPNVIHSDEHIKAITSGITDGNTWLIVCTNERVLLMDKGMVYGCKIIDIPINKINSISQTTGLAFGTISITDGAVTRKITNIENKTIGYFIDSVNKQITISREGKNNTQNISVADEILKFKSLLDSGIISQEEFDKKKKELLN